VHIWKFLLGFCAFLEVPHGILCIFGRRRNFQKCTKFNEEHPKMHKITGDASKYAQNPTMIFRKCKKSHD
jgi:hypothetical protein